MDSRERIRATLEGRQPDRLPFAFWSHFPDKDLDAEAIARASVDFVVRFDLDFLKSMPNGVLLRRGLGLRLRLLRGRQGRRRPDRHPPA